MPERTYTLNLPKKTTSCAVFSSPHSGSDYPTEMLTATRLDHLAIRSSEDAFVDQLFSAAPDFGAPLICATAPRAFVDLNRAASDMDPAIVEGVKSGGLSPAIAAGLGVIPRVVSKGRAIRAGKITQAAAQRRLTRFYHPYHAQLARLLHMQRESFGMTVLFDCHSMPREALGGNNSCRPDIVLGDRFGMSCDRWVSDLVEDAFKNAGFSVARNMPFAGGFITSNYGKPVKNMHAIQIEVDRSIYMNEQQVTQNSDFAHVQETIGNVTGVLASIGPMQSRLAAE